MQPLQLKDFDFDLPETFIAQKPASPRDHAQLLVLDRISGAISHKHVYDLPELLQPTDILVLNDTKVFPARLRGTKTDTGLDLEVLLLEELGEDKWKALIKPGKRVRVGTEITFSANLSGTVNSIEPDGIFTISLHCDGKDVRAAIEAYGQVPVPPYIKQIDRDQFNTYQTVYAREDGSVAAPTAGLHFTEALLQSLRNKGVTIAFVTLHVGLGTFLPVRSENLADHTMHAERYSLSPETAAIINNGRAHSHRIIAVGTTTTRVLESCTVNNQVIPGSGSTNLFITPGYTFKCIDGMMTNFHLPRSTLLMLVAALAGREHILHAYEEAKRMDYRFYSFGDAMFIA